MFGSGIGDIYDRTIRIQSTGVVLVHNRVIKKSEEVAFLRSASLIAIVKNIVNDRNLGSVAAVTAA